MTLQFTEQTRSLHWIALLSNLRVQRLQWIFGDQSLFVRRTDFEAVGGFPDMEIMEDLALSRLLKKRGRLLLLPAISQTSARRFIEYGTWRTWFTMQRCKVQYFLGRSPAHIRQTYTHVKVRRRAP